jgi:hypothetical protein
LLRREGSGNPWQRYCLPRHDLSLSCTTNPP